MKKEINMAEQKSEERKQKKGEIKNVSATKPKRLSRYQYPLTLKGEEEIMLGLARRCTQSNRILRNDFVFICFMFEKLSFCDRSGSSNV